jgi:hypothetical protein
VSGLQYVGWKQCGYEKMAQKVSLKTAAMGVLVNCREKKKSIRSAVDSKGVICLRINQIKMRHVLSAIGGVTDNGLGDIEVREGEKRVKGKDQDGEKEKPPGRHFLLGFLPTQCPWVEQGIRC